MSPLMHTALRRALTDEHIAEQTRRAHNERLADGAVPRHVRQRSWALTVRALLAVFATR